MKTATIRADPGNGWIFLTATFDADFRDDLKAGIPRHARKWRPDLKAWQIDADQEAVVRLLLRAYRFRVRDGDPSPGPTGSGWAEAMFRAVPARLHQPAYRALTKVLHPDAGGDTAAMQQLNDGRPPLPRN